MKVQPLKELKKFIDHLNKYPLITKKRADCELLMKVCEIIERREHLTLSGFNTIVAIRASMNRGLSEKLKLAFPDVVPQIVVRPLVENPQILDPNWLAGFTSAEGCYYVEIYKAKTEQGKQSN